MMRPASGNVSASARKVAAVAAPTFASESPRSRAVRGMSSTRAVRTVMKMKPAGASRSSVPSQAGRRPPQHAARRPPVGAGFALPGGVSGIAEPTTTNAVAARTSCNQKMLG
eukprot:4405027-Prymnesium_polylepis.2